jgi:hypothetical protein
VIELLFRLLAPVGPVTMSAAIFACGSMSYAYLRRAPAARAAAHAERRRSLGPSGWAFLAIRVVGPGP